MKHYPDNIKTYRVSGMSCVMCAAHVKEAAMAVTGVTNAEVSFATGELNIEGTFSTDAVIKSVNQAGYKTIPLTEQVNQVDNDGEQRLLLIRFSVSAIFSLLTTLIGWHIIPVKNAVLSGCIQFVCTIPAVVSGYCFYVNAWREVRSKHPGMDVLIALGTVTSLAGSIGMFIKALNGDDLVSYTFHTVGMIISFVLLGKYLESKAKNHTGQTLALLTELLPRQARVVENDVERYIPVNQLKKGMTIRLLPGERVPADGILQSGTADFDESAFTGESLPVSKTEGDVVSAASLNLDGNVMVAVTAAGEDTVFSEIIRRVKRAQSAKAPIERIADRISGIFVPLVVGIALIAFAAWFFSGSSLEKSLSVLTAVLVVSCPCALGLATPVAIICAVGRGAESGILFKNGEAIEKCGKIKSVVFDKTGTLTMGKPVVTKIHCFSEITESAVLVIAASVEKGSEHPLAKAICRSAAETNQTLRKVSAFRAYPGMGVTGCVDGTMCYCGTKAFLNSVGFRTPDELKTEPAETMVWVAAGLQVLGCICLSDEIRAESKQAVTALKKMRIKTVMVSGDRRSVCDAVGGMLNISEIYSEATPSMKADIIAEMKTQGDYPAMVGDGINDALALSAGWIGMAMAAGTDIAVNAADAVLMNSNPYNVVDTILLARFTGKIIRENIGWAILYNAVCIALASGVFTVWGGPALTPVISAAAMSVSSLTVTLNALRIKRFCMHQL